MEVDESFAQYVAARWSMLYRLATLLVGDDDADDLTCRTLVRAYLSWSEVRAASSPDAAVGRLLVDAALRGVGVASSDAAHDAGPSSGREALWAQVAALPVRRRTLLVLRHSELLSDAEIADALGCSTDAVATEAQTLETGVDVAALRQELLARSEAVVVPLPPIDAIVLAARAERRRRRRRVWTWFAGVAAAVLVAVVLANLLHGASPPASRPAAAERPTRFLAMLPAGAPPRIAWSGGRALHLGSGREVQLAQPPSALVQTRTWLLVVSLSGRILRVDPDTGEQVTIARSSQGGLVTDPAGTHVAWLAAGPGPAVVVVRTLTDGTVAVSDEQEFPAEPRCCDNPFVVDGITEDGLVVASQPAWGRTWVWRTPDGGADVVRPVQGLGEGAISQVGAGGVVVGTESAGFEIGRLAGDRFVRTSVLRARQVDITDPLGHRVLYADAAGEIHVRELRSPGRSRRGPQDVRMGLPVIPQGFDTARWEDAGHVLLDVSDASLPRGALVRCAVDSGSCELAIRFDRAHLVAD